MNSIIITLLLVFTAADLFIAADAGTLKSNGFTEIPGAVYTANTTWRKAESPFLITGDVLVTSGAVLTIEPGVKVFFLPPANNNSALPKIKIENNSKLIAAGTENDSIKFSLHNSAQRKWGGIFADSSSVQLNYTVFEYSEEGIYLNKALTSVISNSSFSNNARYSVRVINPYIIHHILYRDTVFISNNYFINPGGTHTAINLSEYRNIAVIEDNIIVCSKSSNQTGISSIRCNAVIRRNLIKDAKQCIYTG